MSKILIDVIRHNYLEQCASDLIAANMADTPHHAARCIKQALMNADQALNHTTDSRRRL